MPSERVNKLFQQALDMPKLKLGLVCPENEESLSSAVALANHGIAEPILIGSLEKMAKIAEIIHADLTHYHVIDIPDESAAAEQAIQMASRYEIEALMKGSLHTNTFMSKVVSRSAGLRTDRRITHVMLVDVPAYHKLLVYSDVAFNIYPGLEEKKDIVQNAIDFTISLGVSLPKVALLSCVDEVSNKIPNTQIDAELIKLVQEGKITGGIVDGPLQFDAAISTEVAKMKQSKSRVAGDADVLIFPNLEAGNIAVKEVELFSHATCYGIAVGVAVPIIVLSRAATVESRVGSCMLARFYSMHCKNIKR